MADADTIRQQMSQTRAPFSAWLGVVLLFALFGGIVLAVIGPSPRHDNYEQARAKKRQDNLKALHDEDAKSLNAYAWIDKNKGSARIPIERAMELTVADLKQKKPVPAGPIVTPSPAAAVAAPAAPSPVPSASPKASEPPKAKAVSGIESENRGQPAAVSNPPNAPPATQPGASAAPAASPTAPAAKPAVSPSPKPAVPPPGSPLPVRGKETPSPTPS